MSCLFAACVPGLLMVSTYGLQRLENVVHSECPSTAEIVARVERAARAAREKALSTGVAAGAPGQSPAHAPGRAPAGSVAAPRVPETMHRLLDDEPGLPTRISRGPRPNPQFRPSQYANSV